MQRKRDLIIDKQLTLGPKDSDPYRGKLWVRAYVASKKDEKPSVILELEDNGVGMSDEDLESLFVPFFTTKATAHKGTGLGLYVIQRIIEQHHGSIKGSSEYGVGTTFRIQIPLAEEGVGSS